MRLPRTSAQVALFRQAYHLGFTWFDTAPLYGLGRAEPVLATALGRHRAGVIIVTKVGLHPSRAARLAAPFQGPVRAAVRRRPRLNHLLRRSASGTAQPFRLTAEAVTASVAGSTERLAPLAIDTLLLHDVRPEDIEPSGLEVLLDLQRRGAVRRLGVTGEARTVQHVLADHPVVFQVAQVLGGPSSWDVPLPTDVTRVAYGCLSRELVNTTRWLHAAPEARGRLEDAWSGTLDEPGAVARLLVQAELALTRGVVLVGTSDPNHLRELWLAGAEVVSGRSRCDWDEVRQVLAGRPQVPPA